jgi:hypothetical protein
MSRYDYPDPGTDPAYCNAISETPAPARCEQCGDDIEGTVYVRTTGGKFEFCSQACFNEFAKAQGGV